MSDGKRALWLLLLLPPVIGEMLSGSSPPLEFFNPLIIAIFLGMYGAGALLVRELVVIWRKGWASIIALGAAYGVIEEGIAVKSFFDPGWQDLGALAEYGRYLDVNWVWAVWLTIYHSVMSIGLPILLVALILPRVRGERLLGPRGLFVVAFVFVVDIAFCAVMFIGVQDYAPGAIQYAFAFIAAAALILVAWRMPRDMLSAACPLPRWQPWRFMLLGFSLMLGTFVIAGAAPDGVSPAVVIVALVAFCAVVLFILHKKMGSRQNDSHKAYFAAGLMLLFVLLSPIHEAGGMVGMSVVGAAFAFFSYWLVKRVGRSSES
jgi:hypothetical protein